MNTMNIIKQMIESDEIIEEDVDIYNDDGLSTSVEDDAMSPEEEGFMVGYLHL